MERSVVELVWVESGVVLHAVSDRELVCDVNKKDSGRSCAVRAEK